MPVLSEIATMTEVAQGTSLARFGDGELLIMAGKDANHQKYDERLVAELRDILRSSPCLVAVPHEAGSRSQYWIRFLDADGDCIEPGRWYGSAFVSRDDEVHWTKEYWDSLYGLWEDRVVILVAATPQFIELRRASDVMPICSPKRNAFNVIDRLEGEVLQEIEHTCWNRPPLVILSCGPTATVLADRLARKDIWAVDLGNFWKFL